MDPDGQVHFELAEHLPHLFKHIHSQLQAVSVGHLAEFGVSTAVWRILAVLWEQGDLSHRELSERTSIEVSTLSRVSKGAKHDGLIRRTRTPQDQRTVRVALTDKGRALAQAIIPSALECQAKVVGSLSRAEVETLTRLLRSIVCNLNAYGSLDADVEQAAVPAADPRRLTRSGKPRRSRAGHYAA